MLTIGLTGPSGAGKGAVADCFRGHGIPVIDADKTYHQLLVAPSPCLDAIVAEFGAEILTPDGELNRPALGAIVFADPQKLRNLNRIAHQFVMEAIRSELERCRRAGTPAAVIDAPQLFEAGADRDCDLIVAVLATRNRRVARIVRRDGISPKRARERIRAQYGDRYFRTRADVVIPNNVSLKDVRARVNRLLRSLPRTADGGAG